MQYVILRRPFKSCQQSMKQASVLSGILFLQFVIVLFGGPKDQLSQNWMQGKHGIFFLEVETLVSFNFLNHSVQDFASLRWGHGLSQLGRIATG